MTDHPDPLVAAVSRQLKECQEQRTTLKFKLQELKEDYARLDGQSAILLSALEGMLRHFRVFRTKPVGAPGSSARAEQDAQIAAEDAARAAITAAKGRS